MRQPQHRLILALALSLALHLAPIIAGRLAATPRQAAKSPPPMTAQLQPTPRQPAAPPLSLPPQKATPAVSKPAPARQPPAPAVDRPTPVRSWTQAVRQQFAERQRQGLFYPAEAIRLGLEGEPLVLLVLDEAGRVVAARIEQGSGHALLDQAALDAVRALRSLPADAPRQVLLPVRFRLR